MQAMLHFFIYLESQGIADRLVTLPEWLEAMAKMGVGKGGLQFEADLRELLAEKKRAELHRATAPKDVVRNRGTWHVKPNSLPKPKPRVLTEKSLTEKSCYV